MIRLVFRFAILVLLVRVLTACDSGTTEVAALTAIVESVTAERDALRAELSQVRNERDQALTENASLQEAYESARDEAKAWERAANESHALYAGVWANISACMYDPLSGDPRSYPVTRQGFDDFYNCVYLGLEGPLYDD
jgi:hypothetical protein